MSGVHISAKKGGGSVTAVGSTGDVERCLLESSRFDRWTQKQRCRSKVPSVVTARVRLCQIALEGETDAPNDSVGGAGDACCHSHENPTQEDQKAQLNARLCVKVALLLLGKGLGCLEMLRAQIRFMPEQLNDSFSLIMYITGCKNNII